MCVTLLDSPDPAGVGVGRARVVSLRGVLFLFFVGQNIIFYIRTYRYNIVSI